ncbi:metallophosphoesterase [Aeoliella sp. SH292]|uniref:metallophosphoesterase n=1 Tax=Aeoliella sp. SH292 TaxID=3454464 RepID=UPI003F9B9162
MPPLLQPLPDSPLDIVGDIHGEMDALKVLLNRLGYSDDARHPDGRKLVFVGDLTDRGPDSVGAVEIVRKAVEAELACCVLGNHDLNLLLGHRKFDNSWFFGEEFRDSAGNLVEQRLATDADRAGILEFFATLPLALHRPGLRVVHAYWDQAFIAHLATKSDVVSLYQQYADSLEAYALCRSTPAIDKELSHQNENPIKLITSGPERAAAAPYQSSGKIRDTERVPWWDDYADPELCVFGHYSMDASVSRQGTNAICIDFGAYRRRTSGPQYKLAALRLPEMQIACDDGTLFNLI